jgi:hypothetical protein
MIAAAGSSPRSASSRSSIARGATGPPHVAQRASALRWSTRRPTASGATAVARATPTTCSGHAGAQAAHPTQRAASNVSATPSPSGTAVAARQVHDARTEVR